MKVENEGKWKKEQNEGVRCRVVKLRKMMSRNGRRERER